MDYRTHAGDTLSGIAARFDVSLAALEAANPQIADPDVIFPNELIHIPSSGGATPFRCRTRHRFRRTPSPMWCSPAIPRVGSHSPTA